MVPVLVGVIFLCVGAGVYHFNTESHDTQLIFPNLSPDQTVAVLFGIGVLMICVGAVRWLTAQDVPEEEERPF